jgi:carbamoyl-phosphate synthase large subunit
VSTIRALRLAPEPMRVVAADMNPLAPGFRIADESVVVPAANARGFSGALLEACAAYSADVLIPTVDEEVGVLSGASEKFRSKGVGLALPPKKAVDLARDKYAISSGRGVGVKTPKTFLLDAGSVGPALEKLGLPCVVKQRIGRGGRGFAVVESKKDALFWLSKSKFPLIIQERVDGDVELIQGIARDGKTLTSIAHRRLESKGEGSGTAVSAVTVKDEEGLRLLDVIVRELRWTGALGVEFIVNRKGHYLIDVNPRICGQSHLSAMAGINLAYGLVQLSTTGKVTVGRSYAAGKAFVRVWEDQVFGLRNGDLR